MTTHTDSGRPRALASELTRFEALSLLKSVPMGRVVFTHDALPAIRPVNHLLIDDRIVIQTHTGAALLGPAQDGAVVAYEADALDPVTRTGWSVVVTGVARLVQDPAQQEGYATALVPWVAGPKDQMVSISIDMVTGYRIA
ncbi:pyridoxamine 5'-phosphate oxidase family protein [Streptomyces sp. NPDC018833]|uniref:pyridoxamine 5'-phosphate oxidase family protein n=1 Tax=Streptomyces sp. NPDC018833 TaxID=3365053 RepID=UPI0037B48E3B